MAGIPKNKGMHWKLSEETKNRISITNTKYPKVKLACKVCNNIFEMSPYHLKSRKGYNRKYCSQKCYGQSLVGHKMEESNRLKLREACSRPHTEETKLKISMANSGENNGNWNDGSSFKPYPLAFNRKLRKQIRARDQHRCQQCFRHQDELGRKLEVHHIDFNKENNSSNNLISLCKSCHSQTQFNRENWINYFNGVIQKMEVCGNELKR
jgi:hypothetical protein